MNRNVIIYADSSASAPFRYRCLNIAEATKRSKKYNVTYFVGEEHEKAKKELKGADILIIERQSDKNGNAKVLIREARRLGVRVVYSVDDLVFALRFLPLLMKSTHSRNFLYWFGYVLGNNLLARRADVFITTNQFLADMLYRVFRKPSYVIPNFLNQKQIEASRMLPVKSEIFTIGYFSGSPTHYNDFLSIEIPLTKFLASHPDSHLFVVGCMEFSDTMKSFFDSGQIEILEKVNYVKLQSYYSSVSVNLAPLVINDFTNCKSELKFFEAAIAETTTLASPTYTFAHAIRDGETGFLCKTTDDWYNRLEYLYSHPEENKKIAKAAKKYCIEHYYGPEILKTIEDVYDKILESSQK